MMRHALCNKVKYTRKGLIERWKSCSQWEGKIKFYCMDLRTAKESNLVHGNESWRGTVEHAEPQRECCEWAHPCVGSIADWSLTDFQGCTTTTMNCHIEWRTSTNYSIDTDELKCCSCGNDTKVSLAAINCNNSCVMPKLCCPGCVLVLSWETSRNRFKMQFPSFSVGCLFHFIQCVWRKIQNLGLTEAYIKRKDIRQSCKMLIGLAFVPAHNIVLQIYAN